MVASADLVQSQLIERLADGFTALLKQVEELKRHSEAVEKLLGSDLKVSGTVQAKEKQDQEVSISQGVEAWKRLTADGLKSPRDVTQSQCKTCEHDTDGGDNPLMPEGHPVVGQHVGEKLVCPFASMSKEGQTNKLASPVSKRPDSLPTPPETRENFIDEDSLEQPLVEEKAAPPSVTGSFSKCPIRMLDERPPEEIAEYCETHKHEIPRSHEICVKRYQGNERSIRQLDAKYGNLVTMIQGLGVKHQPLLPTQASAEPDTDVSGKDVDVETDSKTSGKVEKWANNVKGIPGEAEAASDLETGPVALEDREGRFDRPLKEIRVGESPSRPWGIQVPLSAKRSAYERPESPSQTPVQEQTSRPEIPRNVGVSSKSVSHQEEEKPRMVFTGPVFIGYSTEQAAALIKQSGLGA